MTIEEETGLAYCWGQNHGGVNMTEIPDFVRLSKNKIIQQAFIHGLYWCQDAGPVVIFTTKYKDFANSLMYLLLSLDIDAHVIQVESNRYSVCPNTCTDEWKLGRIIVGGTKRERFD